MHKINKINTYKIDGHFQQQNSAASLTSYQNIKLHFFIFFSGPTVHFFGKNMGGFCNLSLTIFDKCVDKI